MTPKDQQAFQEAMSQILVGVVNGLLSGEKRMVIESRAFPVNGDRGLTDYKHTFRVEDTNDKQAG